MSRVGLWVAFGLAMGPLAPPTLAQQTSGVQAVGSLSGLTEPMIRQVVQRRDDNVGNVVFVGTYAGNVDGFQARSSLMPGVSGVPVLNWTALIDVTLSGGHFVGIFRQPAGGFYNIEIRPTYRGQVGGSLTAYAVGVGEVFLTAGQSNTTNWGLSTGTVPDLRVSCFVDGPGRGLDASYPGVSWRWGYDPQPAIDLSTGGSVWPTMASRLASVLGVPVGLYAVGCGGTSIQEWLPGHVKAATLTTPQMVLFSRLTNAIRYFNARGGARAVLWDQGETDYQLQTNATVYQAELQTIINQSRSVTGMPIKWMVAQATTPLTDNVPLRVSLENAQGAVVDGVMTFPGPVTDFIGLSYRSYLDGQPVHFTGTGLQLLGTIWSYYITETPGLLAIGVLPGS